MSREFPKNPELKIAIPTVGRIVHVSAPDHVEPLPAVVVEVTDTLTIATAHMFAPDGLRILHALQHVSDPMMAATAHSWDWMEYQKGQAAKTEKLESELGKLQSGAPSLVDGKR